MKAARAFLAGVAATVLLAAAVSYLWLRSGALSARNKPTSVEYKIANFAMGLSIPSSARRAANPLGSVAAGDPEARRLYSDNCSVCHGNDGTGRTATAKGLSPEVPDLHAAHVQRLTDGELFYIIKHGIRYTGMPGWDLADDQIWKLVAVVRGYNTAAITPAPR